MKTNLIVINVLSLVYCFLTGCGSLQGGIGDAIYFPSSRKKLEIAIDSLYAKHPEYKVPEKWKSYNNWSARGYDFINSRIFYFKSSPEEMYYVTFIGDSTTLADTAKVSIGISAIDKGSYKWLLNNDLTTSEKDRIVSRFNNQIVIKLKEYIPVAGARVSRVRPVDK